MSLTRSGVAKQWTPASEVGLTGPVGLLGTHATRIDRALASCGSRNRSARKLLSAWRGPTDRARDEVLGPDLLPLSMDLRTTTVGALAGLATTAIAAASATPAPAPAVAAAFLVDLD